MINIISGKISDFELNQNIHDDRPIKTINEMNKFLSSMIPQLEDIKEKHKQRKQKNVRKQKAFKKKFKKGFGSLLLMEVNKKMQNESILEMKGKVDLSKYQSVFNSFLLNNHMQPKKTTSSRLQASPKEKEKGTSLYLNHSTLEFGSIDTFVDEIIEDIDERIEEKLKSLVSLTINKPGDLNKLIQTMLESKNPHQIKLAAFLEEYSQANKKVEKKWLKENENEEYFSANGSQEGLYVSPTKSVSERFSPIRLREI